MAPSNQAAWLTAASARPLEIKEALYTPPGENEIVVKNKAIAMNPFEWFKQDAGDMVFQWVQYPFVMGSDLAGDVVEVGNSVTRFKVGDRVLGHAVSMDPRSTKSSEGAFQTYTVIRTNLASPIPDSLSYEAACGLPLCLSTAACGLYMKEYLALPHPTASPESTGKTILIWGGSTAVGSNAIQLAKASGFEVIATASPKNFDYVKSLGAAEIYDYKSPTVVKDLISAFATRDSVGALAIGYGSLKACIEILDAIKGKKFVAFATYEPPNGSEPSATVESKFIFGSDLVSNEVGSAIYESFLPTALAEGKYIAAPEPMVVGSGLEKIQEALYINKAGVSAKKVVLTL
ncbi:hypothetical protein V502_05307 [Pseudogymnoascus sp. VKM F-4520 (FW-2644)]|nr:hypothetical protein V502_05307 [Pseudogymnoascus sp. VKM F-4520 (FW-2644)]